MAKEEVNGFMNKFSILCTAFLLAGSFLLPNLNVAAQEPTAPTISFHDIGTTHRAKEEISYLAMGGISKGELDGRFYPDRNVTRAEAAAFIGRALDLDGTKRKTSFKDVGIELFASGYIQSAADQKIITGYKDGSFKPDQLVTRGEMAILINRALKYGATGVSMAAHNLMEKGIAQGTADGTFGFDSYIKRSDFAVFLARAINPELRENYESKVIGQSTVTADTLNVRVGPLTTYEVIGKLELGASVDILEKVGNWAYIQAGEIAGFVHAGFLSGSTVLPDSLEQFVQSQTIVIDPGHGGSDPGAIGNGLHESDVTLAIGLKVQSLFEGTGFGFAMTRETDVYPSLSDRVAFAKNVGGDLFLSIHANSAGSSASGTETYYFRTAATNPYVEDSKLLATSIQKRMVEAWGLNDRGVKDENFHVLRENSMPAALLELGFITNAGDAEKLKTNSWQILAAKAIYLGILDYYQAKSGLDFTPLYNHVN